MISLKKISAGYLQEDVITEVELQFKAGEFCAILGPNGAGKSTLLKTVPGFLELRSGEIQVAGICLADWKSKTLAKKIALIPQEFQLQFDFSVEDIVLMGRFPYTNYTQNYSRKDREKVGKYLQQLDLLDFQHKMYSQLSGGEKQRVAIARALVQETDVILMDESFSHLDINHQIEIMDLVTRINREMGKLVILVSHNINLAAEYCDRIILLKQGKVVADGSPSEIVTPVNLKELYDMDLQIIKNPQTGKPCLLYPGHEK